jgi:GT2 family glycosyltransferase/glycosyltransferase involved in cell wall biosynthesis
MERTDVQLLFDEQWYRHGGPDFEGDAYEHFATAGWRANRNPHPLFDVAFYLEQAPELLGGDESPLDHFVRAGAAAGLAPHILFDTTFYLGRYGPAVGAVNPLLHYLTEGAAAGLDPNVFFVSSYYLNDSPDVAASGLNPLVHYAAFGGRELHRRPHPMFGQEAYARRRKLPRLVNPLVDFLSRLRALRTRPSTTADRPDVSAIVLNLGKSLLTVECVVDLLETTAPISLEVLVVDNGSAPDDFAHLATYLPECVKIVRLGANRYFGEGNNIGVEASSGRLLLFLNNDAFVEPGTLSALLRVLDEHPDAGAVGPRFVYPDGRLQECGAMVSSCGTVTQRGKFLDDHPDRFARTQPVDYVSAACLLMPRVLFDAAGGFDLIWDPAYYEDADLCLKLALLSKRTYYCAEATVTHVENATSSERSHGLALNTVVQINREKFIARWGDWLDARHDRSAARVTLPAPREEAPSHFTQTAVLYTPYPLVPGGGERYLLTIAQALSRRYRTYLLTPERYSAYRLRTIATELGLDLSAVKLQAVSSAQRIADCDLFIAMGNEGLPPIAAVGRRRVFLCQFPFPMHPNHVASAWGTLDEYDDVLVYSEFAARHFRSRAKRLARRVPPVTVLAPSAPMYDDAGAAARRPGRILNVGRFAPGGHCKRQDTLVDAFRILVETSGRSDLELHLVGTVAADPAAREFYIAAHARAQGLPVYFHLNAPPDVVRDLYATSSFYWHATGYGQSETLAPERMEHFGISVVEAMSAGTIPLVYGAGGPAQIVQNGHTGFHWFSPRELAQQTAALLELESEPATELMRGRAHAEAQQYDTHAFEQRLERFLRRRDDDALPELDAHDAKSPAFSAT